MAFNGKAGQYVFNGGITHDPSYPKLAPQWDCLDSVGKNLLISSSVPVHSFEDRAE